jgi:tRNA(fMet)-specific endonuclease VapC
MHRCLLDTDVLSWYLRGHAPVVQRVMEYLQRYPQLELSVMSYYELRRGLVRIGARRRIEQLEAFVQRCQVWEVSQAVAQVAAEIAGELAARGERLDDADIGNPVCIHDGSGLGPGRDFFGTVIGTMLWMAYIAKVNPAFAALFLAWSAMMGVGFAFWDVGEHSNDREVRNFGFQFQFSWGITLAGSVLIMASTINNAIRANASLQGQVAEFWLGYALMLYTTVVLLDIEVEVSTRTSFLDQIFTNLIG